MKVYRLIDGEQRAVSTMSGTDYASDFEQRCRASDFLICYIGRQPVAEVYTDCGHWYADMLWGDHRSINARHAQVTLSEFLRDVRAYDNDERNDQ